MRTKATGGACLKWGTIAVALFGAIFYSARFLIARSAAQPPTFTLSGLPRVTQASETAFDGAPFTGRVLPHGSYHLTGGLLKIHTTDGISLIIEAPSRFKLHSDSQLILTQGRVVAYVPPGSPNGMEIETSRFHFRAVEGEIGVSADANFDDLLVFTGEGELDHSGDKLTPGMGLRFHQGKKTVPLLPRDEAYRFPETMPTAAPRAYGDNLVVNSSFEVGPLSRGCKSGAFYRDMPLGWFAGLLKGGAFAEAEEQHSGSVRLTSPLGGLPRPADGERYLWIERGFVGQLLHDLVPGTRYQLTVSVGCQGGALPGAGQTHDRSGGEATFRFGIWSGEEWIAEHSGQTEPGRGFTEIKLEFTCPPIRPLVPRKNEQKNPSLHSPSIILIGEKGVLYDQIVIRKLDPTAEKLVLQ